MNRHRRQHGFTLVELVMVIAIVGIVAGIAMPRFSSAADSHRADVAARRLVADLAQLRLAARASSTSTSVTFNVAQKQYLMTGIARTSTSATTKIKINDFLYNCTLALPGNAGSATLTYSKYGVPSSALTVYVDCGKHRRVVSVDANSGAPTLSVVVSVGGTTTTVTLP